MLSMLPERRNPRREVFSTACAGSADAGGAWHPAQLCPDAQAGGFTWLVTVILRYGK
jgi:hypothetical protein